MEDVYNQTRYIDYIRQTFSGNVNPLALFLGAGCPAAIRVRVGEEESSLIPGIEGLTEFICGKIRDKNTCTERLEKVLACLDSDGQKNPNIEIVLNFVRDLKGVVGVDTARGLTRDDLEQLEGQICDFIYDATNKSLPNKETPYHKLGLWANSIKRERALEIFTTNYDLLFEEALSDFRIPYFDGFVGGYKPFFDVYAIEEDVIPPRWLRLWKIHGSINWVVNNGDELNYVYRGAPGKSSGKSVIYPSHLKYAESRRQPYLAMLDKLKHFLKQKSAAMIIIGYSFRDDHINEAIVQTLRGNPGAIGFGFLYGKLEDYNDAIKLGLSVSNLSLLAQNEAIIGSIRRPWFVPKPQESQGADGVAASVRKETEEHAEVIKGFELGDFNRLGDFFGDLLIGIEVPK